MMLRDSQTAGKELQGSNLPFRSRGDFHNTSAVIAAEQCRGFGAEPVAEGSWPWRRPAPWLGSPGCAHRRTQAAEGWRPPGCRAEPRGEQGRRIRILVVMRSRHVLDGIGHYLGRATPRRQ